MKKQKQKQKKMAKCVVTIKFLGTSDFVPGLWQKFVIINSNS